MKHTKILVVTGALLLAFGVVWWLGSDRSVEPVERATGVESVAEENSGMLEGQGENSKADEGEPSYADRDEVGCHESDKYFVAVLSNVYTSDRSVLVKYKDSPTERFGCEYVVDEGDYEIRDAFFLKLTDNYVVVSEEAYAGRGNLVAYDLVRRVAAFTDPMVDLLSVENDEMMGGTITYLSVATDIEPSAEVCTEFESISAGGLSIIVLSEVTANLDSGEVHNTGVLSCDGAM